MPMTKEEIEAARAAAMAGGKGGGAKAPAAPVSNATSGRPQYENRSRLGLATPAIRPGMKARLLLGGPAGAGKTYTGLLIAMTLREHTDIASVVMIDTEKDSGRTYADEFLLPDGSPAYKHISWVAPYNAVDLAMTLRDASGKYDVVLIDSHSHFWRGQGGVLDVAGGRWTGWSEARPMHVDMIDAILSCDCHVILCARMTMEHEQVRNPANGKLEVVKLGMKVQQDADLEYEVNVALEMDMNHTLRVTKSRTRAVPVGSEFIAGHAEEFGGRYREWLKGGEPAASKEQVDNLVAALNRIEDPASRMRAKQQFQETFGRPEMLLVSRLTEAATWVADVVLGHAPAADRAEDETPPEDDPPDTPASAPAPRSDEAAPSTGEATGTQETSAQSASDDPGTDNQKADSAVMSDSPGDECQHLSATGVDQRPVGPEKVWACDGCGRRYRDVGPEGELVVQWIDPPPGQGALDEVPPHDESVSHVVDVAGPDTFNGDTGHCDKCGSPIWFSKDAGDGSWLHADDADDLLCPVGDGLHSTLTPAAQGVDVDELYAAAHAPKVDVAAVTAEVGKLSQTKLLQALSEAGLPINGRPKDLKARLIAHRCGLGSTGSTVPTSTI